MNHTTELMENELIGCRDVSLGYEGRAILEHLDRLDRIIIHAI